MFWNLVPLTSANEVPVITILTLVVVVLTIPEYNGSLFSVVTSWYRCDGSESGTLHLSCRSCLPLVLGPHVPIHRRDHRVLGLGGGSRSW